MQCADVHIKKRSKPLDRLIQLPICNVSPLLLILVQRIEERWENNSHDKYPDDVLLVDRPLVKLILTQNLILLHSREKEEKRMLDSGAEGGAGC